MYKKLKLSNRKRNKKKLDLNNKRNEVILIYTLKLNKKRNIKLFHKKK
jgi:hypothetical protein